MLWLDDDGNMKPGDLEGDTVNDCLLVDRNKDGVYDLIVKWADLDGDGRADLQLVAEYPFKPTDEVWPNGHYMIVLDTDRDDIFNYIDWNTFRLECWQKSGICDFFPDYSGKTAFMKMHASTDKIGDLRLNWENPFLFYDPDKDGLTEMAIRLLDSPPHMKDPKLPNTYDHMQLTGRIDWVSIAVDLDNDNRPGQEFDFDFTLGFQGEGFDYGDQVHPLRNMRGLPEADRFFPDPRFRQLTELVYTDHEHAYDLIFKRGKWSRVNFVFDEDDDCGRWERVEFCDNLDPFKVGAAAAVSTTIPSPTLRATAGSGIWTTPAADGSTSAVSTAACTSTGPRPVSGASTRTRPIIRAGTASGSAGTPSALRRCAIPTGTGTDFSTVSNTTSTATARSKRRST